MIAAGSFREDLSYRFNVITVTIPPLRERPEDIPDLARHFLAKFSRKMLKPVRELPRARCGLLGSYGWPGNVPGTRECRRACGDPLRSAKRSVARTSPSRTRRAVATTAGGKPGGGSLEEIERDHILRVLRETGGNQSRASQLLGIDRKTLYLDSGSTVCRKRRHHDRRGKPEVMEPVLRASRRSLRSPRPVPALLLPAARGAGRVQHIAYLVFVHENGAAPTYPASAVPPSLYPDLVARTAQRLRLAARRELLGASTTSQAFPALRSQGGFQAPLGCYQARRPPLYYWLLSPPYAFRGRTSVFDPRSMRCVS